MLHTPAYTERPCAVKCRCRFVLWLSGAQSSRGVNSPGRHSDMLAKCRFYRSLYKWPHKTGAFPTA